MRDDFAVFIITHKRENQTTYNLLKKLHYSGKVYFLCDSRDNTRFKLIEKYGEEKVVVFRKEDYLNKIDLMINEVFWDSPVFVENFMYDFAKEKGINYFIRCDDDITSLNFRYAENEKLKRQPVKNIDEVFTAFVEYMENGNLIFLAPALGGAFIGGIEGPFKKGFDYKYAAMTFCNTKYPGIWRGFTYSDYCNILDTSLSGKPAFRIFLLSLETPESGSLEGGMREIYDQDNNLYKRSFLPILMHPSSTKIGVKNNQFYMHSNFNYVCPKIISDRYKK